MSENNHKNSATGSGSNGCDCYAFYQNTIDNEIVAEYEHSCAGSRQGRWVKLPEDHMVRVRYWCQDTLESGGWHLTGLMTVKMAREMIDNNILENGRLVADSDFPVA